MVETLQLALFGGFEVTLDGVPLTGFVSSKAQALLCYLAVTGRPHLRPMLAGLLWGEMPEDKAGTNLRKALSNLRRLLPSHLIFSNQSVAFNRQSNYALDVEMFGAQIEAALRQKDTPPTLAAVAALSEAAALYRGDFLAGFYVHDASEFEEWVLAERERLRGLAQRALRILLDDHAARGKNAQAIDVTSRLLALDPWREEVHRQMMLLLARSGQRSAALAQYETCRRILAEELGVEPMPETTALYERIRTMSAQRAHLPAQPTPFIGREDELARMAHCFDDPACRLLTLVGPGGIGKTRLALHMAASRQDAFLDGVFFIPLAGVPSPDHLVAAIAEAIHFSFYRRQDFPAQLLGYLQEKEMLLVLDNFDHLLEGSMLLAEIAERAGRVKLMVTSRERLGLRWEWLFDVGGLAFPGAQDAGPIDGYGAVQLFVQTASRVQAGFALSDEWAGIARICRLVEGMPLAIELAASSVRERSCAQIEQSIADNLSALTISLRDVPERHRSVYAAFEGSWQQLSAAEQHIFGRLSVFLGSFDRNAARQVAGADRALLGVLVAKSLLREIAPDRYEMHELIRQYAGEKLAASSPGRRDIQTRHSGYYLAWLRRQMPSLYGEKQQGTLAQIGYEIDNVRAAWQHAVTARQIEALDQAIEGLYRFFDLRGWLQEGKSTFEHVAEMLRDDGDARHVWGRVLAYQSRFGFRLGDYAEAQRFAEQSLGILDHSAYRRDQALASGVLGAVAEEHGDYQEAQAQYEASLAVYQASGDEWGAAISWDHLGDVARMLGHYEQAQQYYEQCRDLYRQIGDQHGLAQAFNSLGGIAGTHGDYDQARVYFEQSLAAYREMDDRYGIAGACHNLGSVAFLQGDYMAARQLRQETLSICREIGFRWGEADSLRHLADVYRQLGEYAEARRLYQESLALKREIGHQRGLALALSGLGGLALLVQDYVQAREMYWQALQEATKIDSPPVVLSILAGWGELAAREDDLELALALLYFVRQHPAAEKQTQDRVTQLISEIGGRLSSQAVTAAEAKAKTWTLEAAVQSCIQE